MIQQLNTVLSHLYLNSDNKAKSKSFMLQHLNIPRPQFDAIIRQLNRDGYINIFMRSSGSLEIINRNLWEEMIVFELSARGKAFQKNGGYEEAVHHNDGMKSAVGF